MASATGIAGALHRSVASVAPHLAFHPRTPLRSVDTDRLASAVLTKLASARAAHAASPLNPTSHLASAVARNIASPRFQLNSVVLASSASRLASAVARRLGASEPLQAAETDAGAMVGDEGKNRK